MMVNKLRLLAKNIKESSKSTLMHIKTSFLTLYIKVLGGSKQKVDTYMHSGIEGSIFADKYVVMTNGTKGVIVKTFRRLKSNEIAGYMIIWDKKYRGEFVTMFFPVDKFRRNP